MSYPDSFLSLCSFAGPFELPFGLERILLEVVLLPLVLMVIMVVVVAKMTMNCKRITKFIQRKQKRKKEEDEINQLPILDWKIQMIRLSDLLVYEHDLTYLKTSSEDRA